jgi:hypothetical protein
MCPRLSWPGRAVSCGLTRPRPNVVDVFGVDADGSTGERDITGLPRLLSLSRPRFGMAVGRLISGLGLGRRSSVKPGGAGGSNISAELPTGGFGYPVGNVQARPVGDSQRTASAFPGPPPLRPWGSRTSPVPGQPRSQARYRERRGGGGHGTPLEAHGAHNGGALPLSSIVRPWRKLLAVRKTVVFRRSERPRAVIAASRFYARLKLTRPVLGSYVVDVAYTAQRMLPMNVIRTPPGRLVGGWWSPVGGPPWAPSVGPLVSTGRVSIVRPGGRPRRGATPKGRGTGAQRGSGACPARRPWGVRADRAWTG